MGGAGTYVVGNGNVAFGADSFVLGSNVTARGKNSVVLGANSDGSLDNVVSVGDVGSERRIVHVAPGVSATDAVNMSQLKALGATTNTLGTMTNAFVAYDGVDKSVITLGAASPGTPGSTPAPAVTLTNLKAAALSAQSSDAVNGAQLNATNTNVQDVATSLATLTRAEPLKLAYTNDSKSNVVLGGTGGTILSNLKAGVADQDAVNVAQLKNAGLIDSTGNTLAAITYDTKADGAVNRSSVTLGGSGAAVAGRIAQRRGWSRKSRQHGRSQRRPVVPDSATCRRPAERRRAQILCIEHNACRSNRKWPQRHCDRRVTRKPLPATRLPLARTRWRIA